MDVVHWSWVTEPPRCGKLAARMETPPQRLGRMMTQAAEGAV